MTLQGCTSQGSVSLCSKLSLQLADPFWFERSVKDVCYLLVLPETLAPEPRLLPSASLPYHEGLAQHKSGKIDGCFVTLCSWMVVGTFWIALCRGEDVPRSTYTLSQGPKCLPTKALPLKACNPATTAPARSIQCQAHKHEGARSGSRPSSKTHAATLQAPPAPHIDTAFVPKPITSVLELSTGKLAAPGLATQQALSSLH